MYGGHEYEFGTRQPLGEVITGQRLLEQVAGQISLWIDSPSVMNERKKFGQDGLGMRLHQYEGPGQLNIEKDDIVLVPREGLKKNPGVVADTSPFASFSGSLKLDSATEYRLRYRFMGLALTPFAFNNDGQGKGITAHVRGVGNFINRTGKVLKAGDLLTWEPNLDVMPGEATPPKRMKIAGHVALKARFAKYEPMEEAAAREVLKTVFPPGTSETKIEYELKMLPLLEIVGRSAECTQPNEWGRIILP